MSGLSVNPANKAWIKSALEAQSRQGLGVGAAGRLHALGLLVRGNRGGGDCCGAGDGGGCRIRGDATMSKEASEQAMAEHDHEEGNGHAADM